jgi:hypothetical protein
LICWSQKGHLIIIAKLIRKITLCRWFQIAIKVIESELMTGAAFNICKVAKQVGGARCKLSSISVEMGQGGDRTPRQGAREIFLFPLVHRRARR